MSQRAVGLLWVNMEYISLILLLLFEQIQGYKEMIQMFLPTGKESNISFPVGKLPENDTISLFDPSNKTIGTCYPDGKTKVTQRFNGKVKIPGPTILTFLSPQTSDSGLYYAKVTGDKHNNAVIFFNVTFQDQDTVTTPAAIAVPAVLAIVVAAAAAAVVLYLKKRERACFAQRQTESSNSQLLTPPQVNGDSHVIPESNHLMEENIEESPV